MVQIELPTNLLIILSVIIFIVIVGCIIYVIYKDRKKDNEEIDELIEDLMTAKPRENLINAKIEVPIGENIRPSVKEDKVDLEDMLLKMQKSLSAKQEEVVENFEAEQEEKAIISYQELLNSMKSSTLEEEIKQHEMMEEQTASELTKQKVTEFLNKETPKIKKIESLVETEKKFKNTDFISPIFGKQEASVEYPTIKLFDTSYKHAKKEKEEIMNEIDEVKTRKEISINSNEIDTKNDEFLRALKQFRSNL